MFQRPSNPEITTDFVVIGAGVTGLEVAKILHAKGINFWMLGSPYESQLAKTSTLDGSSLPTDITGLKFMEKKMEEIESLNVNHSSSLVTSIEKLKDGIKVSTKYQTYITKGALLAIGLKQSKLGFDGEKRLFRLGISDCAVCDFPLYRDRPGAVVGNHKYTEKAARFISQHCSPSYLLWYQTDNPPEIADMTVYKKVENLKATGIMHGNEEVLHKIEFDHDEGHEELQIDVLFVEGEPVPSSKFLEGSGVELDAGFIKIDGNFRTNIEGIFAAGDITRKTSCYQEAKDHGIQVAEEIIKYLS